MSEHYEWAEHLVENPMLGTPNAALVHAILALIDKLDEIPILGMQIDEEEE